MDNSPEIVICDLDQDNIDIEKSVFNAAGVSFERLYCKSQEDIIEQCGSATVLMVQYLKIDEEIFKALPTLKMVVRFGVGVDNINLEFKDDAIKEIARIAVLENENSENIGARRLHTILEKLIIVVVLLTKKTYYMNK